MAKLNKLSLFTVLLGSSFFWFSFTFIDQPIANAFHHFSHKTNFYSFFQFITLLGDSKLSFAFTLISFLVASCVLFKKPQHKLANNLLFMGLAMIGAIFIDTSMKYLLGRYRPELLFQQGLYGFHFLSHQFLMNSTPSGHATRIFVLATGFSLAWKKITPIFILLGLLVCFSRLVLEFHYLSDVVFGGLLGSFITLWVAKIYYSLTLSQSNVTFLYPAK